MVEYKTNTATAEEITHLLKSRDDDFIPKLSSRVDLNEYGLKLKNNATNFEAWDRDKLVGIVSAYMNNFDEKKAYISMVCVDKNYSGKGVSRRLMHDFINEASRLGFGESSLEVHKQNKSALALYQSLGYHVLKEENDALFLVRKEN